MRPLLLALALLAWTAQPAQADGWYIATSYCCVGAGGGYCGTTASGERVGSGQIAADWRVLPRGTAVDVAGYGPARVTDTGSAIVGNRIDVFFPQCADAWRWGRRTVWVRVGTVVSPRAAWAIALETVRYWDSDSWVVKTVWDTERGRVETFDVEGK